MRPVKLLLIILTICLYNSCSSTYHTLTYNEIPKGLDSLEVHEGILSKTAHRIKYRKGGKTLAIIELSEPVMVAMADKEEKWGFFQFPCIYADADGALVVSWQMKEDSHKTYGKNSDRHYFPMMSVDGGKTWKKREKGGFLYRKGYDTNLRDGGMIRVYTPPVKDINSYKSFPQAVKSKGNHTYYKMSSLPVDLQGVYLNYYNTVRKAERIHARLNDPELVRYAIGNLMPIVWWGDIKVLADNSLVAGIYPTYYMDNFGQVNSGGVSFYRSVDAGRSWNILGKISFQSDGIADVIGDSSYDEPSFEILQDSTFMCVMRTGMISPMYKTFSYDRGRTWSCPEPFTPNGVLPKLLLLNNGVLVLTSGRPGVQIRFNFDGKGRKWSDPIDMIPFMKDDGTYTRDVSCGYPTILENDENSFYIVYSDFTTKNTSGQLRKSIWCRKVTVLRK